MASSASATQTVAVVDDDDSVRLALQSLLRSSGLQVQVYDSAEDFLGATAQAPDCMIVDVGMPGKSGTELVHKLLEEGRSVPAIFISALDLPSDETSKRVASGRTFLRKPFGDEHLLSAVRAALREVPRADDSAARSARAPGNVEKRTTKEWSMDSSTLRSGDGQDTEPTTSAHERDAFDRIVGAEGGLSALVHRARLLIRSEAPLLLQGETGVGKELFARAIHAAAGNSGGSRVDASLRGDKASEEAPFAVLNCGGLPRDLLASELFGYVQGALPGAPGDKAGALERASGGTLFLDEIGELPLDLQGYLLRVLESGEFYPLGSNLARRTQFRLITGSSRDLRAAASEERFRKDLLFRISGASLQLPPLRERLVDLPLLLRHFVSETCTRHQLTPKRFLPDAQAALEAYAWPGNVRELRNVIESLCLVTESDIIDLSVLPEELRQPQRSASQRPASEALDSVELPRGLQRVERAAIDEALRAYNGNLTRVARELEIARSTLYLKLKKYDLEPVLNELRFGSRE